MTANQEGKGSTLEKVARAIADNIEGADPDSCRYAALAALSALLPLTEEMVEAGIQQYRECTDSGAASAACVAEHVLEAMVSAAISKAREERGGR